MVHNKKKTAGSVKVISIDDSAKAGYAYGPIDKEIEFKDGQVFKEVQV
jgi:hypothetical protein